MVLAIDTRASIGQKELGEFATEVVSICDTVTPERIRILWWDYEVAKEQVFDRDSYQSMRDLLKPDGGGGTRVSCVSEYIIKHNIESQAIIVFTDGYVENDISWDIQSPTLWVVTESRSFKAPSGKVVKYEDN